MLSVSTSVLEDLEYLYLLGKSVTLVALPGPFHALLINSAPWWEKAMMNPYAFFIVDQIVSAVPSSKLCMKNISVRRAT